MLRMSNLKWYKYDWIWNKKLAGNGILAKIQPLKIHENILIFSNGKCLYYPIIKYGKIRIKNGLKNSKGAFTSKNSKKTYNNEYKPKSILNYSNANFRGKNTHPTQKPVDLLKYLICTYTNENELVLDNCIGSGSTAVACHETKRNFIGIEKDEQYFKIAQQRIKDAQAQLTLF